MGDRLLRIEDLHVKYETDESNVYAVNGVNLELNSGETLGIVGETGAGKTTLALSIMQLLPKRVGKITEGEIWLAGVNMMEAKKGDLRSMRGSVVSMIFQDPMSSLNPVRTVGNQIEEALKLHSLMRTKEEYNAEVERILKMVGISPKRRNEYPHQFSGGMKQRIVIAIALACRPKLILADEPTTALDVTIQAQVLQLMSSLQEELQTSIIMITHDFGIVAETCDKVAVMYAGEIVEYGTLEDIFKSKYHHPYTVGLFKAIPNMKVKTKRLYTIDGLMPDPTVKKEGCSFAPRCPFCSEICTTKNPVSVPVDGIHNIKCFHFKEIK